MTKYGSLAAFLAYKQYAPVHIWYIAPSSGIGGPTARCTANGGTSGQCTGNDSTGVVDDINHPYATWSAIQSAFIAAAGTPESVMLMMRDGYSDRITNFPNGTSGNPVIALSYPE